MGERQAAVILGTFHTSLALGRSLGRKGVPVYAFDLTGRNSGGLSRYVTYMPEPGNEEDLCSALIDLSAELKKPPVMFITSDTYLEFLLRYQDRLAGRYLFYPLRPAVEGRLMSKCGMEEVFTERGVARPKTWIVRPGQRPPYSEISTFPVIAKPNFHDRWLKDSGFAERFGKKKVLLFESEDDLRRTAPLLLKYDTLIIQECIPGPSTNLYYYIGLRGRDGRIIVSFVGNKLRTYPEGFGSEVLFQPVKNLAVREAAENLLHSLDYQGVAGLDFKFDAKTGEFKLIEINPRFGLSDGLVAAAGIDLPYLYYRELLGLHPEEQTSYRTDIRWYWLEPNIDWFRDYGSRKTLSLGNLALDSLRYRYNYLIFARDDLRPFFEEAKKLAQRLLRCAPVRAAVPREESVPAEPAFSRDL